MQETGERFGSRKKCLEVEVSPVWFPNPLALGSDIQLETGFHKQRGYEVYLTLLIDCDCVNQVVSVERCFLHFGIKIWINIYETPMWWM